MIVTARNSQRGLKIAVEAHDMDRHGGNFRVYLASNSRDRGMEDAVSSKKPVDIVEIGDREGQTRHNNIRPGWLVGPMLPDAFR